MTQNTLTTGTLDGRPNVGGKPRMGKLPRVVVHLTVDTAEAAQLTRWAGSKPPGHALGWLIRHARKTKFRPKDYAK